MAQYIYILKGEHKNWKGQSEADEKAIMAKFGQWVQGLGDHYKDCKRLHPKMAQVTGISASKKQHSDGPHIETKEVFSGIFEIEADSFDQAVELAKSCPMLSLGEEVLVLPIYGNLS